MKHIFSLAVILCLISVGMLSAQETDDTGANSAEDFSAGEELSAVVDADNPGMGILDQATEAKLRASAVSDLSQVILLCQRAKKTGLSGENLKYCNQLLASTQLQRGLFLAQSLLNPQGTRPRDWTVIRQTALADIEQAVTIIKDQPTAYVRIAQLNLLPDGDENRAKESLKLAIQHSNDEPALQLQALRMLSILEPEPEKREKVLADAANNGSPEIKLLHALTLLELNRNNDAMNTMRKLIESESENTELHDRIIATLADLGKYESAMKVLDMTSEKATGERKNRIDLMKAELLFKMEQDEQALALLNTLSKKFEDNSALKTKMLKLRSSVHFTMDNIGNAMKDIEEAEKVSPNFPPILQQKYDILMSQKKYDAALEVARKLQSIVPEDRGNFFREIQVFTEQKKYNDALEVANKLHHQSPDEPQWVSLIIEIYSKQEAYDKALTLVEEQLKENPDDLRWIIAKSQIFSQQDKWNESVRWLESCLSKKPDAQELNLLLISVLADSKNYKAAKERIQPLLEKAPDNLLLIRLDSQISTSLGLHREAIESLTKVIEADPKDYTSINNLSWIFSTSPIDSVRDGQKALELAEKACELTFYKRAFILSTLAAAYAELGNFEKAREWSQKSIDLAKTEDDKTEEEQKELLENLQKELETFKNDMPFRELTEEQE